MAAPIVYPASAGALPPDLTDEELVEEFVAMAERKPRTLEKYAINLEEYRLWLEREGTSLLTAQRRDVVRFLAYLKGEQRVWRDSKRRSFADHWEQVRAKRCSPRSEPSTATARSWSTSRTIPRSALRRRG